MKRTLLFACIAALVFPYCNKNNDQQTEPQNQNTIQIKTLTVENIYPYQVDIGGDIADDGGDLITSRGVCWSETDNPSLKDSTRLLGSGTGIFKTSIKSLQSNHRYYAKAFATNRLGTVYGNRISFITAVFVPSLPTIYFTSTGQLTQTTCSVAAQITSDGGAPVTERGFLWDSIPTATFTATNHIAVGSDTGRFSYTITGLAPYTKYNLYAYAINSAGIKFSNTSASTLLPPVPVVVTAQPTFMGGALFSGGTITAGPGFQITKRGIGYQTNTGDRTEYFTDDGAGSGTYISKVSRILISNAIYYARAYAEYKYVSSNQTYTGTVYAPSIQFSTY